MNLTCQAITDPMCRRNCRCHHCLPSLSRLSTFIPFHRRPRSTPTNHSDPSIRPKNETPSDTLDHPIHPLTTHVDPSVSSSSPLITHSNPPPTNEKTNEWTASTPNSVISASGPPSVLAPHNESQFSSKSFSCCSSSAYESRIKTFSNSGIR